jgi:hypothetical protein
MTKSISVIDKSNIIELKEELYNRKRDLVSMRIHGTLKQDPVVIKKAKDLKKECQKISMFISTIEKVQKESLKAMLKENSEKKSLDKKSKQVNKKAK